MIFLCGVDVLHIALIVHKVRDGADEVFAGLEDLQLAGSGHSFNVLQKSSLDERSFFNASTHCLKLLSYLPARFTMSLSERL